MKRNPDYLYRITREKDGRWLVRAYLEQNAEVLCPQASFTDDALPDWVRKDVALLSMVDPMGEIKGLGHRVGEAFWLVTETSRRLAARSQAVRRDMADDSSRYVRDNLSKHEFFGEIK